MSVFMPSFLLSCLVCGTFEQDDLYATGYVLDMAIPEPATMYLSATPTEKSSDADAPPGEYCKLVSYG